MEAKEFILEKLSALAVDFPHIHIKYGFDSSIDTHVVQIDPMDQYYENEDLDNAWIPISIAFIESFEDSIAFISSDSSLKIDVAEVEWKPSPVLALLDFNYQTNINQLFTTSFNTVTFPQVASEWDFFSNKLEVSQISHIVNMNYGANNRCFNSIATIAADERISISSNMNVIEAIAENTTYALAA